MLKGKSKAFKPKGPIRRPGPGAQSGGASREPTREPTPREATPSLKRKEREEDTTAKPPPKRLATPPPSNTQSIERRSPSTPRETIREPARLSIPTPEPTQDESSAPRPTRPRQTPRAAPKRTPLPQTAVRSAPISNSSSTESETPAATSQPESLPIEQFPVPATSTTNIHSTQHTVTPRPTHLASASNVPASIPVPPDSNSQPAGASAATSLPTPRSTRAPAGATLGPAVAPLILDTSSQNAGGSSALSLGGAGDVGGGSVTGPSQVSQLVPMAALNPDGTSGGIIEPPIHKGKKKKVVKRKKVQADGAGEDDRATIEIQLARPRLKKGKTLKKKKREKEPKNRTDREETPDCAEEEVVDPTTLTMSALCKDLRIGKKFSRHDDIKARVQKEKEDVKARRRVRENPEPVELNEGLQGGENDDVREEANAERGDGAQSSVEGAAADSASAETVPDEPDAPNAQGRSVTMRIVDGQIVVDERSMQIDRHREAENAQDGPMEVVEENDFTRIITSGTYMKREKNQLWDWPAMEIFYKGLRTFGTDFGMIANMFPHRSRKQVKLRFNREEKDNPELVNRALSAPQLPINFEEYMTLSKKKYMETAEIEAEQNALKQEHEASLAAAENRNAAANKKKKDAIRNRSSARDLLDGVSDDEDDHAGGSSAKENRAPSAGAARSREASTAAGPGKRGKRATKQSRANKHSMRAGGDEVEVLGAVE